MTSGTLKSPSLKSDWQKHPLPPALVTPAGEVLASTKDQKIYIKYWDWKGQPLLAVNSLNRKLTRICKLIEQIREARKVAGLKNKKIAFLHDSNY